MERLFGGDDDTPGAGGTAAAPTSPGAPAAGASGSVSVAGGGGSAAGTPLAARMRPSTLEEFVGQRELLAEGSVLRRSIDSGQPHSMILHGPPGSGKTTLARLIAAGSGAAFEEESAVQAGRAEVRAVIERARERRKLGRGTVFFLDEIHRFNKAQQDALLPAVEEGLVTLIGATTENPYFAVNSALLSRLRVYELAALEPADVRELLVRAIDRGECGDVAVDEEALDYAAEWTGGDARAALGALELACSVAGSAGGAGGPDGEAGADGEGRVTLAVIAEALQQRTIAYDRQADNHYDTISAWIKATRGSDPDASLYYLAVMLEAGEDPRFIVRRMVILASEDIGNADPQALTVAVGAAHAVEHVGLPECEYALAQAAIYLSLAPKSDATKRALGASRGWIREHGAVAPPPYLRSSTRREDGYDYPHARPGHLSPQSLLPERVREGGVGEPGGVHFYEPDDAEAELRERLAAIRRARGLDG
jgi:putative ATPase